MRAYESVAVLGGGLYNDGQTFRPSTYKDSDHFGMLGGYMRIVAALGTYLMGRSSRFIFSGGTSAKLISTFGVRAPVEAEIYHNSFLEQLTIMAHDPNYEPICAERGIPQTTVDPIPPNTVANLQRIWKIANSQGHQYIGAITSEYHVPRARAWWEIITNHSGPPNTQIPRLEFLSAEEIAMDAFPGIYDDAIIQAYNSEAAKLRLKHEACGLEDLREGRHVYGEFQLTLNSSNN